MSHPDWPKAVSLLVLAGLCAYANVYTKTLVFDDDAWIVLCTDSGLSDFPDLMQQFQLLLDRSAVLAPEPPLPSVSKRRNSRRRLLHCALRSGTTSPATLAGLDSQ